MSILIITIAVMQRCTMYFTKQFIFISLKKICSCSNIIWIIINISIIYVLWSIFECIRYSIMYRFWRFYGTELDEKLVEIVEKLIPFYLDVYIGFSKINNWLFRSYWHLRLKNLIKIIFFTIEISIFNFLIIMENVHSNIYIFN